MATTTTTTTTTTTHNSREIDRIVKAINTSDGAGVRLKRSIGTSGISHFDPFLLLDEFKSDSPDDYIEGFPEHPHRGFETVTYMLAGDFEHRDHRGNCGRLISGSAQWMTAGRGILHSEMPIMKEGLLWGFQLWVNLPKSHKMIEPRYQDIGPEKIPKVQDPSGATIKVVAGESNGIRGPIEGIITAPLYLDVHLPAGQTIFHNIEYTHNAFLYIYEGNALVGSKNLPASVSNLVLTQLPSSKDQADGITVTAGSSGVKYLLVAAKPINEPIARRGPFVMNTSEEIYQAFRDYQNGTLGA